MQGGGGGRALIQWTAVCDFVLLVKKISKILKFFATFSFNVENAHLFAIREEIYKILCSTDSLLAVVIDITNFISGETTCARV